MSKVPCLQVISLKAAFKLLLQSVFCITALEEARDWGKESSLPPATGRIGQPLSHASDSKLYKQEVSVLLFSQTMLFKRVLLGPPCQHVKIVTLYRH